MREIEIEAYDLNARQKTWTKVDCNPDICPICHRHIEPRFIHAVFTNSGNSEIEVAFQCTNNRCLSIFVGGYSNLMSNGFELKYLRPKTFKEKEFPDSVKEISPKFIEIMNQADEAGSRGLDQLEGIGLRKALEFLIKEYLIAKNEDDETIDKIKRSYLGACINTYINDSRIKKCAELAAWLGNDETHYIRKWEDKDISDLRKLIKLTINWIDSEYLTEKYQQEMARTNDENS